MIVVTIKRTTQKKHYQQADWDNNTDSYREGGFTNQRRGMLKKELSKDMWSLAKFLDKRASATTEIMVEKNKNNEYYHAHLIIHTEAITSAVDTLLSFIGATQQREEERWIESLKIIKKYYRSIDGKYGEIYWTTAFDYKGALGYLQKTEATTGDKQIFISKVKRYDTINK